MLGQPHLVTKSAEQHQKNLRPALRKPHRARALTALLTLSIWTASSGTGVAESSWARYSSEKGLISYQLPTAWQVENEATLEKAGYLTNPHPTYVLLAGAEPARLDGVANPPSTYAFSETPSPWFTVWVATSKSPAPSPRDAYEVALDEEVAFQRQQGVTPSVVPLTKPVEVSSGGLLGSQDRSEVIVPGAGTIELNEVVYSRGSTVWMTMAGCTLACYAANAVMLNRVIGSVRVGAASY
jgi:hypothetical protein